MTDENTGSPTVDTACQRNITITPRDAGQISQDEQTMTEEQYLEIYGCRRQPLRQRLTDIPLGAKVRIRHVRIRG
jgi:hypothetical protein